MDIYNKLFMYFGAKRFKNCSDYRKYWRAQGLSLEAEAYVSAWVWHMSGIQYINRVNDKLQS